MAFLDDLGKAFSNAGQKTKDMADIAKCNSQLAEEEKKINNIFFQIGKTYVQLHPQDYEEPLAAYIQAYQESQKQIEDIQSRLKQLRNIVNCPNCGTETSADIAFCSVCGYRFPPKPVAVPAGMTRCATCGAFVPQNMKFCTGCGAPMPILATMAPAVTGAPAAPAAPAVPSAPVVPPVAPAVPSAPVVPVAPPQAPVAPLPEPDPIDLPEPTEPPLDLFAPLSDHAAPDANISAQQAGGITCTNCGTVLEDDCAFCVVCGTPVGNAPASAGSPTCPNCGAALDDDSVFCIECGTKVK